MRSITRISTNHDLARIVDDINQASWDDDDVSTYDVASLTAFLTREDTLFITCYAVTAERSVLQGMCSGRLEYKPYGGERWLYIDEVDVCTDRRRKGVGSAMMRWLLAFAREAGCQDVWLATEQDNDAANGLYRALKPDDIGDVVGYGRDINR